MAAPRQCSLTRPVCVEGSDPTLRRAAVGLLAAAYETTVLGNQGPNWPLDPLAEPMLWRLSTGPLTFDHTLEPTLGFDRGRPTCAGGEITRDTALACAAASSLLRVAPGTAPALRAGWAGYVAHVHDGGVSAREAARRSLEAPEQGLLSDPTLPATVPLLQLLERKASPGRGPSAPWLALLLPAERTPLGSPRPSSEPDFFDVLKSTLGAGDPDLARLLGEVAALRFDEAHRLLAGPALAWEIDGASLPRNLVLPRPLAPTGSAYVVVRLDAATARAGLALRTFCETGSSYVWSMARLDGSDRIQSRVEVPSRETSPSAEGVLRELDGTPTALIIGTSLGGGPDAELDPDELPLPVHSCEVVLDRLPAP